MKEKDIQTIFSKHNKIHGVFELKLCKTNSIRYDAVRPHQMDALKAIKGDGLFHKITDSLPKFGHSTFMRFTSKKPFDCFFLKGTPSYIVICLYTPRKEKLFCYICPEEWEKSQNESTKKSLNREEIVKIAHHYLQI